MPRYGAAGPGTGRHGSARPGRGQGVVTVRSGCPELCPRARGSARAREGGGCGSRGSARRGSKGKASERPERVRGSRGSLPGGRGWAEKAISSTPRTGTLFAARFGAGAAAIASSGLWGEPAGLGGGEPEFAGSGPRSILCPEPEGRSAGPSHSVRSLSSGPCVCVWEGVGAGSWPGDSPAS